MGKTSKVIVCGSKKCGKTAILEQALYGKLGPFHPTLEDVYESTVSTDRGTVESLRFYDTEGLESKSPNLTETLPRHLFGVADGVLIVYSIDDEGSFQIAEVLRKEAEKHKEKKEIVIVVLGNKSDLSARRQVDQVQALDWAAREKVRLFEVSALDRHSLHEPLVYLSSKLNPPQSKSSFPQLSMGRSRTDPSRVK